MQAQIQTQRRSVADTLGLPPERVFALSAREGLAARVSGSAGKYLSGRNLGESTHFSGSLIYSF